MSVDTEAVTFGGRTAWARNLAAPVRSYLSTESGGAIVMLGAAVAALLWANLPGWHSYESVWTTSVAVRVGNAGITMDLRHWVNEGLMTLFFLVVGLEAKRQLDLGELRERRRLAIPVFGAIGGITVPILIYLAFNAGRAGAHGWGAAMSTDTAFALGLVALLTPRTATRIRVFLLTLAVVDDLAALVVIATVYTSNVSVPALTIAIVLFGGLVALRYAPYGRRAISIGLAVATLFILLGLGAVARVIGKRKPEPPTQARWAVPAQLDRADFEQLAAAGFLLSCLPVEYGGVWESHDRSLRSVCELLRELAHGDSSVALVSAMLRSRWPEIWFSMTQPAAWFQLPATWRCTCKCSCVKDRGHAAALHLRSALRSFQSRTSKPMIWAQLHHTAMALASINWMAIPSCAIPGE